MLLGVNMKWLSTLWILAEIAFVKPQGFENGLGTVNGLVYGSMVFSWSFDTGQNNVTRIRWLKDDTNFVFGIVPGGDQGKGPDYTGRMISYIEPYGFELFNLTTEDAGKYQCEIKNSASELFLSDAYLKMFDLDVPLEVAMVIEGNSSRDMIEVNSVVKVSVWAPYNDPPAVNISIVVSNDVGANSENCDNMNETIPCILEWTTDDASNLTVKSCLAHPAVSIKVCEQVKFTVIDLPTCQSCKNGGTCNQTTLKCICLDGFTGDTCDKGPDDPGAECKWWCILLIVLPMVIVVIVIICCCWHYKVACFRHKCCPWSSNHSRPSTAACSKVDVNDVERTVTSGSHGNKQDAGNKDSPYRDVHRPDGHMPQKGDGSHGLQVPQGVPVTNSDQKRPMPSPGRKTVLPPLEDPERSKKKKKKKNRKSREEE